MECSVVMKDFGVGEAGRETGREKGEREKEREREKGEKRSQIWIIDENENM